MQAKEIAVFTEVKLLPQDTVRQAIALLRETKLQGIPVVNNNGEMIGIFTRSNLYDCLLQDVSIDNAIEQYYVREAIYFREDKSFQDEAELVNWLHTVQIGQTPVVDMNNKPIGIITQARAIKELLSRMEYLNKELLSIIENVPTGIIATDETGCISLLSKPIKAILEDVEIGGNISDIITDLNNELTPIVNGAWLIPRKIEYKSLQLIANIVPIFQDYKMKGTICVLQDLTNIERIAHELKVVKELKEMLETVLDVSYEGVAVINVNQTIIFTNGKFCEFIGRSRERVIGQNLQKLIPSYDFNTNNNQLVLDVAEINNKHCILSISPFTQDGNTEGFVVKIYQEIDQLSGVISQLEQLNAQMTYYKDELSRVNGTRYTLNSIVFNNAQLSKMKAQALQVARSNSTVLITGESGTGKELFAHGIHNASARRKEPFIKVNCSAIPGELAESELFGYEDGAFTGARKQGKPGKFEMANGGTIFLDEIGDMALLLQSKLLRVIQEKEVERVGGTKTRKVNVRIIAATNKDLKKLVSEGKFREDLYFRLNVVELKIPPLRERKEDIPYLVESFIRRFNKSLMKSVAGITDSALEVLMEYDWPGNVRELENVIERILNYMDRGIIGISDIPLEFRRRPNGSVISANGLSLVDAEQEAIGKALREAKGNKAKAARILGISRSTLYQKLLQLEQPQELKSSY